MKKLFLILLAVMFISSCILISCFSRDEKVENAEQNVKVAKEDLNDAQQSLDRAKQDTISDFQKFKNSANIEINSNEKSISDFRLKMRNEKKMAREKYEKTIDAMEKENNELKDKLEAFKDDGKKDWKKFKTDFNNDLAGLGKSFKDFGDRITK